MAAVQAQGETEAAKRDAEREVRARAENEIKVVRTASEEAAPSS